MYNRLYINHSKGNSMTGNHYNMISRRIKEARDRAKSTPHALQMIDILANQLAQDFEADNPAVFERSRFLEDCETA